MNIAYLLIGGNLGDREKNLGSAKANIQEQCGEVFLSSSLYETAAWGNTEQPSFLNQALAIKTSLTPIQLMRQILKIEKQMGRIREEKYGPRLIDIDILIYNDEIKKTKSLILPHPELQNRRFALLPLSEIAPGLTHPVFQKKIISLLKQCTDKLAVKKYS